MSIMLAILGFITVIGMLVLIITKKAAPLVALIAVSVVTGIIPCFFIEADGVVDFVANFKSPGGMITGSSGIGSVAATGVMFIFSILFFGILTEEEQALERPKLFWVNIILIIAAIVGVIGMPASLLFDPDSFYYGVLPVLAQTAEGFGVAAADVGRAAILGQMTVGFPVSPLTASTFLLIGCPVLTSVSIRRKPFRLVSIVMVVVSIIIGAIAI